MTTPVAVPIRIVGLAAALEVYDRIKIYRSVDAQVTFEALTTKVSQMPRLQAGRADYSFIDRFGVPTDYWYRFALYNATTGAESPPSPAKKGGNLALTVLTVEELKANFLLGVQLYMPTTKAAFPSAFFEFQIAAAVAYVSKYLDVPLVPQQIVEKLPYYRTDYANHIQLKVNQFPFLTIDEVALVLPVKQPPFIYDPDWIMPEPETGEINIIPGNGALMLGNMELLRVALGAAEMFPQVFHVTYTCGFDPVPIDLVDVVGKLASIPALLAAGDLVYGPGIVEKKVHLDSLMTQLRTAQGAVGGAYGARILELRRALDSTLPKLRVIYKGVPGFGAG